MAAEQIELKKARKTGKYEVTKNSYGYVEIKKVPEIVKNSWLAASRVSDNRIRITAALNLYHELRGSVYRHNYCISHKFYYDRHMKELTTLVNS